MTDLLLLRHGQSAWNALGRWQGQADPPLSELGEQQATHAALRLPDVDAIVASDLRRAVRTAEIIAAPRGLTVRTDPDLRERHAGAFQGLTKHEIEERWPGWLTSGHRPPDFESDESVLERTTRALERIAEAHDSSTIVVVCHGGIVYSLERAHDLPHERLANLGGRWLHFEPTGRVRLGERVTLVDENEVTIPDQL
jgi:probable phosphoglycerate mutase